MNNPSSKPHHTEAETHGHADESRVVRERLRFMQMTPPDCAAIRSLKPLVERELPVALDKFYAQVRKTPETMKFFSSEKDISRAAAAQAGHWGNISNGDFSQDYATRAQTVGRVHARIGLEPRWYMGGYAIILDHLIRAAADEVFPKGGLFSRPSMTAADFGKALGSLAKAVLLDMDLSISVYIDEAEKARQLGEANAIAEEQKLVSDTFGNAMAGVARKDLTCEINSELPEAYHPLREDFNNSVEILRQSLLSVAQVATSIESATGEISRAADDLSARTVQQAASVEKTAASLDQITVMVRSTAKRAEDVGNLVERSRAGAEQSEGVVQKAMETMSAIERSSGAIGSITDMMDEIAFQTNLLALNAGVEAARAGEAGRGFAVIASEVRVLAQRSASAAKEIKALITQSREEVRSGVALVGETGSALKAIVGDVAEINQHISAIVEAARGQASGLQDVNAAVATIDHNTQQNAAMVEQTSAASRNLAAEVRELSAMLGTFRLEGSGLPEKIKNLTSTRALPVRRLHSPGSPLRPAEADPTAEIA
ncbi:methyl-accepting chemotaxis protein [Acetobacter musti]